MSNIPENQHSKNPVTIDILLSVIDNFGDMGFACELMIAYEQMFPGQFHFRVLSDDLEKTMSFLEKNTHLLGSFEVVPFDRAHSESLSDVIFSLFHYPLPDFSGEKRRIVLRFDYLSFDIDWIAFHGREHIRSNNCTEIREIIPSVYSPVGLIQHHFRNYTRENWLLHAGLSQDISQKKWVTSFVYGSITDRIDMDTFDNTTVFFTFSPGERSPVLQGNHIILPLIPVDQYYALLDLADFNIVRGEVSFVQALFSGKPFLWDMYKGRGGFHEEQSSQFLEWGKFDGAYIEAHMLLNRQKEGQLSYYDLDTMITSFPQGISQKMEKLPDLVQETKKYVDRFYFSL